MQLPDEDVRTKLDKLLESPDLISDHSQELSVEHIFPQAAMDQTISLCAFDQPKAESKPQEKKSIWQWLMVPFYYLFCCCLFTSRNKEKIVKKFKKSKHEEEFRTINAMV